MGRVRRPFTTLWWHNYFPPHLPHVQIKHYSGVIMASVASQITSLTIVHSTVYSFADQRKHQSSASLAFVREIHQPPVFPFDDVIIKKPVRIWVKPTGTKPQWIIRCVNRVRKFSYVLYHRHLFNVRLITHHPASYLNKPWSCTRYEQWISKVAPVSLVWYI